ncbi:MAG: DUF131 domain-containing protein [Candidatus Bathyarchaeota archaeon]|nr:DUF131 domain-containing protein [Candidatus Bathyarchaeota archaeon]
MQTAELGLVLIVIGVAVLIFAAVITIIKSSQKGNVKAGGVIMIGPVPIIFGTDKEVVKTVLVLSIVLMVLAIVLMFVYNFLGG